MKQFALSPCAKHQHRRSDMTLSILFWRKYVSRANFFGGSHGLGRRPSRGRSRGGGTATAAAAAATTPRTPFKIAVACASLEKKCNLFTFWPLAKFWSFLKISGPKNDKKFVLAVVCLSPSTELSGLCSSTFYFCYKPNPGRLLK